LQNWQSPSREKHPARVLNANPGQKATTILKITTIAYLSVWVLFGLLAFIFGYLLHPGVLQPLSNLGQSWLGIAVAAAYEYMGINQKSS
jgi:predicted metal-binding membrane protein